MVPSVVHPKRFRINGMTFRVVTLEPVSDEQAAKIAMHSAATGKFKKAAKGKTITILTTFDSKSANLLG